MHAERILWKAGDKPNHPRILLLAHTRKAISLIGKLMWLNNSMKKLVVNFVFFLRWTNSWWSIQLLVWQWSPISQLSKETCGFKRKSFRTEAYHHWWNVTYQFWHVLQIGCKIERNFLWEKEDTIWWNWGDALWRLVANSSCHWRLHFHCSKKSDIQSGIWLGKSLGVIQAIDPKT